MNNSVIPRSLHRRGLYLGVLPEMAAARGDSTSLTLDHDLDVLPEAGRRITVGELAGTLMTWPAGCGRPASRPGTAW